MDKFTIRGTDGSIDQAASVREYANTLAKWAAENEVSSVDISSAVDSVFDKHTGRLTLPVLISYTMAELQPTPAQFTAVENQIRAFVKQERFNSSKGKGGGIIRLYREGETPVAAPVKKSA